MKNRYKNLIILIKMVNRQKALRLSFEKMKNYNTIKPLLLPIENPRTKNEDTKKSI